MSMVSRVNERLCDRSRLNTTSYSLEEQPNTKQVSSQPALFTMNKRLAALLGEIS